MKGTLKRPKFLYWSLFKDYLTEFFFEESVRISKDIMNLKFNYSISLIS